MGKPLSFEVLAKQDIALLAIGVIFLLLTFSKLLGMNGFLTFILGCGFMAYSAVDLARITFKQVNSSQPIDE